jgi:hypothetical protein
MKQNFKKAILVAAVAGGLGLAGTAAMAAGLPVTIDESSVVGAVPNIFNANQLSGQYDEVFTATSASTFVTEAIFNAGGWFQNAAPVSTQVNAFGAGGYGLYAKFASTGSFGPAAGGGTTFLGGTGIIELWSDADKNTNYDVKTSAIGSIANLTLVSGAASITDDRRLGFATLLRAGEGTAQPGLANGNFELVFGGFTLDPDGLNYFIAPNPFYMVLDLNGNFQSFVPSAGTSIQLLGNSANAFFTVPEPSTLALAGMALLGFAGASRRRKS